MNRREFVAAMTVTGAAICKPAIAQAAWPAKGRTIRVIVPWPPGAANDALGRLVAQRLQEGFGRRRSERRFLASGWAEQQAAVLGDHPLEQVQPWEHLPQLGQLPARDQDEPAARLPNRHCATTVGWIAHRERAPAGRMPP